MIAIVVALVASQPINAGTLRFNSDTSTMITANGGGRITLRGGDGDRLVEFRNGSGTVVSWIDAFGNYRRPEDGVFLAVTDVARERERLERLMVSRIVGALPYPPRGFRTSDAIAFGFSASGLLLALALFVWGVGPRRLVAQMLTRPLRRLGKWLDRGQRQTEVEVLRFKRDLNRTIEQLESERRP